MERSIYKLKNKSESLPSLSVSHFVRNSQRRKLDKMLAKGIMKKKPDAGWTREEWAQLDVALHTPLRLRTVAQSRLVFYWREGHGFRLTKDVWNWRERGLLDS